MKVVDEHPFPFTAVEAVDNDLVMIYYSNSTPWQQTKILFVCKNNETNTFLPFMSKIKSKCGTKIDFAFNVRMRFEFWCHDWIPLLNAVDKEKLKVKQAKQDDLFSSYRDFFSRSWDL